MARLIDGLWFQVALGYLAGRIAYSSLRLIVEYFCVDFSFRYKQQQ